MEYVDQLDPDIVTDLQNYICQVNPSVPSFQAARDFVKTENPSRILHYDQNLKSVQ